MFPVLFSIGSVTVKTASVLTIIAIFSTGFIFWRKGREEHYETLELFDGFLLAILVGGLLARLSYIFFNFSHFGLDIGRWLNLVSFAGFNLIIGIFNATLYLYHFALKKKWDAFEVLDFWVTSISLGLFYISLGQFFAGVGYGYATKMPWGVVFPQLVDPHHPVQLYFAIFYLFLYFYLSKVEYSYRTFSWYRHGKKTAQTGFLTSMFLILVASFNFLMSFFRPASFELFAKVGEVGNSGVNLDAIISFIIFFIGISLLYYRSGRPIPLPIKRKPRAVRTKLENLIE